MNHTVTTGTTTRFHLLSRFAKGLLAILLLAGMSPLAAQSVEKAKDLLRAQNLLAAQKEIDGYLTLEKNQKLGEAWYTKAKIYTAISMDEQLFKSYPDARMEAFKAIKRYTEVDDKMLISLQIDGYKPINDLYTGAYQLGANSFNAKKYDKALSNFKDAIEISSFMTSKGWINLKLDTNSVLYAGVSAEKLMDNASAAKYYSKLIDHKVTGEGFVEIYKWVANYYFEKKDLEKAKQYITAGRAVYPGDIFWNSIDIDLARLAGKPATLFAMYDKIIIDDPSNYLFRYNYAVELYQYAYNADETKRPADSKTVIKKAIESIKEALRLKADYSRAQLFAGQIRYNEGVDLLGASKKASSAEQAKLKQQAITRFDEAAPYFLEVGRLLEPKGKLKQEDKQYLKEAYDLLITIYDQKGDKDRVKEFEVKFNEVDKKH